LKEFCKGYRILSLGNKGGVAMNDKPETKVAVKILDEEYVVKGEEDPEYIIALASYVDRKMSAIQQRNPHLGITKVAVLTALNIADELSKLQEDYDEILKQLAEEKKKNSHI